MTLRPTLADAPHHKDISERVERFRGSVVHVTTESFEHVGQQVARDVVRHPGAVGVIALRPGPSGLQVLLVRQYRHPVGRYLWEIPAGLLDVHGEDLSACARRELREEAGYEAGELSLLLSCLPSPGGSDEVITVFYAWDPTPLAQREVTGEAEEQDMSSAWFDLDDAVTAVMAGDLCNQTAQVAILAAALRAVRSPGQPRSSSTL